jgi:dGTPase
LIELEDLEEVEFWRRTVERVRQEHATIGPLQFQPAVVRGLIDWQVHDLLEHTRQRLRQEQVHGVADVRRTREPVVGPGPEVRALKVALEDFLRRRVYRHARVQRMAAKGSRFLRSLFAEFCRAPQLLPRRYSRRVEQEGDVPRVVCDYLAGMTDRYAQNEYLRLFQPYTDV